MNKSAQNKIWAFNSAKPYVAEVYESIKGGFSRFGWSDLDENNLHLDWTPANSKQWFLKRIKSGDWIVHINTPKWDKCVAAQVTAEYAFDDGIDVGDGHRNFRHCIAIDTGSMVEFRRNDPNVLPNVNLSPRQRYHRVYAKDDFLQSIENLKSGKVELGADETRGEYHLKERTDSQLETIASNIHETHKGKKLESFLAKVIRRIPGVTDVTENGSRWGTDHGADLIVTLGVDISDIVFEHKVVVQIKSYEGKIYDLNAVEQIKTAITKFNGAAGLLITTAESTEQLDNKIFEVADDLGKPIELLSGRDVARLVLKYAPDLLFKV